MHLLLFYTVLIVTTALTVTLQLHGNRPTTTTTRKVFHLLIVLVYLPGLLCECELLYLATGVAFAIMTVVELFRLLNIPPMGVILKRAFEVFADSKDVGLIAFTPFCLLIGCSLPLWLMSCQIQNKSKTCGSIGTNFIPLSAGVLTIGFGDTAASVIGSRCGRHKWSGMSFYNNIALLKLIFKSYQLFLLQEEIVQWKEQLHFYFLL